jgi:hypothetical protein
LQTLYEPELNPAVLRQKLTSYEQFIGGFKGDWEKVPSGQNQESKRKLLEGEGVLFDANGYLIDKKVLWDEFNVKESG